ncbi:hypothetical protein NRB_01070 [Novosphingobium sp. 11B]|uniref:GSCFA domain-containing protein n=1 Tax=Novosphingobium resinovorum TaxID=158500 RepID=UPI000A564F61|nr:GSCFA domain-containing protein [Novosphingobium resinovorum]
MNPSTPPLEIDFTRPGPAWPDFLLSLDGFSGTEPIGRWTDGETARIVLAADPTRPRDLVLVLDASPFVAPGIGTQGITVTVNGRKAADLTFSRHFRRERIEVRVSLAEDAAEAPLEIGIGIRHPAQPSQHGMGDDGRHLGLLIAGLTVKATPPRSTSPYSGLPAHQFWRRSISAVEHHRIDPVTQTRFKIGKNARVGTAGSCFAQHISRRIMASGFNYLVTEAGEGIDEPQRVRNNYGTFSARYGNVYTTVQLLQLFEEAFGQRVPRDRAWPRPDGRFIDPFRQQIEPDGFADEAAVIAERDRHLAAVRRLFEDTDIFVFTLGLTEAWRSREDGSVFSAAPGVVGGAFDESRHEFVNFDLAETYGALETFLEKFHALNPGARVLLTVSPVPLIATYEPRSVLVSTTYSKSVLRVAAEMALKRFDWVDYFPSYEIITGSFSGGLYYEDDRREVNALGVSHAMRCFMQNYIEGRDPKAAAVAPEAVRKASAAGIVCDEEIMDSARA